MPNQMIWFDDLARCQALWRAIGVANTTLRTMMPERFDHVLGRSVHHYTDLGTGEKLIQHRNLWLTDARYCNDREEMQHAMQVIESTFGEIAAVRRLDRVTPPVSLTQPDLTFLASVLAACKQGFADLSALVCCFCEGDNSAVLPRQAQDILSQWRGYGANGRGACVSFDALPLEDMARRKNGMLFDPVLYEADDQKRLIEAVAETAVNEFRNGVPAAVQNGSDALAMITPLFKHTGFAEELEWRLVFMPQFAASPVTLSFRSRPDLLVPYADLVSILGTASPLTLSEVMVGPSNLQDLNEAAFRRVPGAPPVAKSIIPYRV